MREPVRGGVTRHTISSGSEAGFVSAAGARAVTVTVGIVVVAVRVVGVVRVWVGSADPHAGTKAAIAANKIVKTRISISSRRKRRTLKMHLSEREGNAVSASAGFLL